MKEKHIRAHMKAAYVYADLSYCKRRKVGCVIVKHNSPIAIGYNGMPSGERNQCEDEHGVSYQETIHAEDNAFRKLTRSSESAEGGILFVTTAPCIWCAPRIVDAGIVEVYYCEIFRNTEGVEYLDVRGIETTQIDIT